MQLELLVGILGVAFLLVYFAFKWDTEEHYLFQLLISFFFFSLLLLVPKAIVDNPNNCELVVNNQTVVNNVTSFTYRNECVTTTNMTHTIFYKTVLWLYRLFALYIFLYFNYVLWLKNKLINWNFITRK